MELIFYIALFGTLSLLVINGLMSMTTSFRETMIQREISNSAGILERISRDIRQANDITTISEDSIILSTTDQAGDPKTVQFSLNGNNVELRENNILIGNLNTPNIEVGALSFTELTTTRGRAVRIFMAISSTKDIHEREYYFYNTIVLRGSY